MTTKAAGWSIRLEHISWAACKGVIIQRSSVACLDAASFAEEREGCSFNKLKVVVVAVIFTLETHPHLNGLHVGSGVAGWKSSL